MNILGTIQLVTLTVKPQKQKQKKYRKYDPRKGHCDYCNMYGHTS